MKALVTTEPQTASVQDVPTPSPGEGEILVKVSYVGQNPTDWKGVEHSPPGRIIGCDFVGTVAEANGSQWREGQRVAGWVQGQREDPVRGAFAEYLVTEASLVFAVPDNVADAEAATVPLAFATAVQALFQRLKLPEPSRPAKTAFPFLVAGATTSVGKYAVQLAKLAGLYVVATGSAKNHALLRALGADATIDYRDADWAEQVRKVTHDGLEHAFECVGDARSVLPAMSPTKGGHVVSILPVRELRESGEAEAVNKKVRVESTLAYSVFGRPLPPAYADAFDNTDRLAEDKAVWEKYLSLLPSLLGNRKIRPNEVREMGGLEDIPRGFKEQEEGRVSAQKLVYKIA
ncbi:zinc-binding dehydrogenase [Xylariomycetidae sp. FL2044]|nr:zinc-binding dehydrogenase [Xylariomycetidae sp. FL2044]